MNKVKKIFQIQKQNIDKLAEKIFQQRRAVLQKLPHNFELM